ncbi:MAG: hypothetical protein ACTTIX_03945 [Peptoanaerobacter stomatis]
MKAQIHTLYFEKMIMMYISSLTKKIPKKQRDMFKEVDKSRKKIIFSKENLWR